MRREVPHNRGAEGGRCESQEECLSDAGFLTCVHPPPNPHPHACPGICLPFPDTPPTPSPCQPLHLAAEQLCLAVAASAQGELSLARPLLQVSSGPGRPPGFTFLESFSCSGQTERNFWSPVRWLGNVSEHGGFLGCPQTAAAPGLDASS